MDDTKVYINLKLYQTSPDHNYYSQNYITTTELSYSIPRWFQDLFTKESKRFCDKYSIEWGLIYSQFFNINDMRSNVEKFFKLFKDAGYDVEMYDLHPFPSFGLVFDHRDPKIVELKLKA